MDRVRWIALVVLLSVLTVFGFQNLESTSFVFLIWSFEAPRIVLILLAVLVGFIAGWLVALRRR